MKEESVKTNKSNMPRNTENIRGILKYSGSDVDDGSMSVEDIVPALQGFSSLYGKLATDIDVSYQHKLRVTGVQHGSFEVVLAVWSTLGAISPNLQGISSSTDIAKTVIKTAFSLIRLTKHVQQKPFEATPKSGVDNTIQIKNSENVTIEMPINIYNYYQERTFSGDLTKIVKPIEIEKIDKAELSAEFGDEVLSESIDIDEKKYFESTEVVATTTDKTWIQGRINAMTKTTNKGAIYLADSTRVPFKLEEENPEQFYRYFGHQGLVKVLCKVNLDENLKPISLDIFDIEEVQTSMFNEGGHL